MPDNNRKVLSDSIISKFNEIYKFTYDEDSNTIVTTLKDCKRVTNHDANNSFLILSKKLGRKIIFSIEDINFWKEFQKDPKLSEFTLFDIHNSVNKLKALYQPVNSKTLADILLNKFYGIRKII